ncbi:MAG: hypothetical protein RPU72_01175 [Candidatus Sedimenticola sp. (ex Thyasira tokunagai)]
MMGEYGDLFGGGISSSLVALIKNVIDFIMTPTGLATAGIFFLLLLFFARR